MFEERLETIVREYENPDFRKHKEYYNYLRGYNLQIQKELQNFLIRNHDRILNEEPKGFIGIVGSDARLEKGEKSPIELLIIKTNQELFPRLCYEINKRSRIFSGTEIKNIEDNMLFYKNEKDKLHPSRMIDVDFIYGDYQVFTKSKENLIEDIKRYNKKIRKTLKERDRYFRKILIEGKNKFKDKEIIHYDTAKGIAYYDEEKNVLSFKAGPLRYIQNKLIRYLSKKLVKEDIGFLLNLPSNTNDRIYFLSCSKDFNLSQQETEEIIDSYKYFLKEYHRSQRNLHDYNQNETSFNINEVKNRLRGIKRILEGKDLDSTH